MPNKNNKQKRRNRKSGRAPRTTRVGPPGTVTVPRGIAEASFPIAIRSKQRYFYQSTVNGGGTNVAGNLIWRTNSVYDPDFTYTGAQPAGFGALATLYNYYRVVGARWHLTIVNDCGATVCATILETPGSAAFTNYPSAAQQGFATNRMLSDQSGGRNQWTFKRNIQPWKVHGVSKERYMMDDQFAAAVTTNPVQSSYLHLVIVSNTTTASVQYNVDVVFDVVFYDRVTLA